MLADAFFLLLGLVLLIAGGDLLVRGAVRIAERLSLSPMLIGLTVVGMGTSMPELAASVQASLAGSPGIAIGNIVGSNIANALLILGIAALITPIAVKTRALWRDGGIGTLAALALLAAGATVGLSREAGIIFLIAMGGYVYYAGSLLVDGAIKIAEQLGVSDAVIGLTIVAVGTSFPELVTSAVAAYRKEGDIALGNVLASNIYNILFIGGITGVVAPTEVPASMMAFDLPLLVAVSLVVMVFAFSGGRLSRKEGFALVASYAAYAAYTVGMS